MISSNKIGVLLVSLCYYCTSTTSAFSMIENRRDFLATAAGVTSASIVAGSANKSRDGSPLGGLKVGGGPAVAAEILTTEKGVKYAITKSSKEKGAVPQPGDIVAIEYTGYLSNGQIFDATHAEGKKNALLFKIGSTVVIPGLNDIVSNMSVGEKVQAIIPPELAFGSDGICLENGECLIKPGSTLVYDVLLKKTSIPPP